MQDLYSQERAEIIKQFDEYILSRSLSDMDELVKSLFEFQFRYNPVFHDYCISLGRMDGCISSMDALIYLPISAFKHHEVKTGVWTEQKIFRSSATTGMTRSKHYIRDLDFYLSNAERIWKFNYNPPEEYCFLALLPGYLERDDSSLVAMVSHFMNLSKYDQKGFYLHEHKSLYRNLQKCRELKVPTVLFGVSFALMDFLENFSIDFPDLIVIETGGLKGKYQAISRNEIYQKLKKGFGAPLIHSEYGMTELLSQVYSQGDGLYQQSDTLRVITRQINDPLENERPDKSGILNIIDIANIDSCCFIQTEDIGVVYGDGSFSVQGRLDFSELRGCNLMVEN